MTYGIENLIQVFLCGALFGAGLVASMSERYNARPPSPTNLPLPPPNPSED